MSKDADPASATPDAARGPERMSYCYRFDDVEYNDGTARLSVAGQPVALEPRPLRLLAELLRHVNEVVTKEELLDSVWDGRPTVENVLSNAVTKLRRALGEAAAARVTTVPRLGYRFEGPIERVAVGQPVLAALHLEAGQPVPGRESLVLDAPLGRTGRGNVWLAHHAKLRTQQRVFKFAADAEQFRQLKREYTLLRVLQAELGERGDIVRLLDCNFGEPPFFIESEFGGSDLSNWAAGSDAPLAAMSRDERLALFLQVARAVAAAHSVGVLHKDLKPSNVLISGSPGQWQVRLTDFGSGRALDPQRLHELNLTALGLTMTENVAASDSFSGTPLYLAPELLAGKAPSMQSDVYALGILLYQLLAGDLHRPMSTGWQRELGDDALLREDITAATEGRPEARLAGVAELIDRIEHLPQRRAQARRQQEEQQRAAQALAEQARRRSRRPWLIGALASLSLALAVSLWFYADAARSARVALAAKERAQAINDFLSQDVLQAADITRVGPGQSLQLPDILARASTKAGQRFQQLPVTEADVRLQLGALFLKTKSAQRAETEYRRALELLSSTDAPRVAGARYGLAMALLGQAKVPEADAAMRAADAQREQLGAQDSPRLELAAARAHALDEAVHQRVAQAVPHARRIVELTDQIDGADLNARFEARSNLVEMLLRDGRVGDADKLMHEMLAPPYSAAEVGEVMRARAQIQQARIRVAQKRLDEALALLLPAREVLVRRLGDQDQFVAQVQDQLASIYILQQRYADARVAFIEGYRILKAALGEAHPTTRGARLNIALVGLADGRSAEALRALDEVRPFFVSQMGDERSPIVQLIDFNRVRAMLDLGRASAAAPVLAALDVATLAQARPEPEWPQMLQAERGLLMTRTGQRDKGLALLRPALAALKAAGSDPYDLKRYEAPLQ